MKILIRLPNWLGDVVMSTAFIHAVRQFYPDAIIDVIIKKELGDLASLIGGINKVYLFSKKEYNGLAGVYRYGKSFRSQRYDVYFNLPHSLSSAAMAWASRAKQRVGFSNEGGFFLLTQSFKKPANLHRVDEYLSLLEGFSGIRIIDKEVSLTADITNATQTVVINFNSEASSRRMPLNKGRSLINTLTASFKDVVFIIVGSLKEAAFINEMVIGLNNAAMVRNYAGKTDLKRLAELIVNSKVVLTTDSGPAHLANALGTPTIVLFGAGNEKNTAPYNNDGLTVIRYGELVCEPCVRNTCRLYDVPKCMEMLEEIKIINALSLHLNNA
jgi:heptosyltransferase-2